MSGARALGFNLFVALATTASGCALTSRGEPANWKYFTPERVEPELHNANAAAASAEVCIGRVSAGAGLGRRIAYGKGGYEVGYYDDRRWNDEPEHYVRRALERTLFQRFAFRCDPEASAPTLVVEVLKFEEVRSPTSHGARVAVRALLAADQVIFDETIQVVHPVVGSSFDDVVAAMGRALDDVSADVARRTGSALAKARTVPTEVPSLP